MRHIYINVLRNIQDGTKMLFHQNIGSPWIKRLSDAQEWLSEQKAKRLDTDNIERPNTKWVFESFFNVEVKVVLDRERLVGTGLLPDWLRNMAHGREGVMVTLDTYRDNLCLWRCIAVHQGLRVDRCERAAKAMAKSFYKLKSIPPDFPKTSLDDLDKACKGVYEPERAKNGEVIWKQIRSPPATLTNILTIGVYKEHAFVIKDIAKLAKIYECNL